MAARAVVRDVGRALGMPYGYVDRIAKLIPFEIGITLDKAIADDEELRKVYENDEEVRGLIDLAKQLEGLARNVGTHAGGVVIAPQPITEYMPLYADAAGALLTQLDKDDLEAIGLIKFDFLGLKTLTIIDKAVAAINRYARRARRAGAQRRCNSGRRREDLRAAAAMPHDGGVPARVARHARLDQALAARPVRRPHRDRGTVPAGPDADGRRVHRAQARLARATTCIRDSKRR